MLRLSLIISACLLGPVSVQLDDPKPPPKPTGCEVGAEVPAFYVREITGNRPNLAICLVCKNGDRPAVLISARKIDSQVERLLEAVDRTIDSHRAEGLRGFAIFLSAGANELKDLPARLMTLAHDRNLSLPLTIPVESSTGPASLKLPEDVQTTVLLYVDKKIISRAHFKTGELTDPKITALVEQAKIMAKTAGPSPKSPRISDSKLEAEPRSSPSVYPARITCRSASRQNTRRTSDTSLAGCVL